MKKTSVAGIVGALIGVVVGGISGSDQWFRDLDDRDLQSWLAGDGFSGLFWFDRWSLYWLGGRRGWDGLVWLASFSGNVLGNQQTSRGFDRLQSFLKNGLLVVVSVDHPFSCPSLDAV